MLLVAVLCGMLLLALLWNSFASNGGEQTAIISEGQDTRLTNAQSEPDNYLPAGAKITDRSKDVVSADLDGDGQTEKIIFYSISNQLNSRGAGVLVLKRHQGDYVPSWEKVYDDSGGFGYPTGVYDLNGSGKPQIVVYRTIGASCPGVLDIFESTGGKINRITGAWTDNGACQAVEINDLNRDGANELIIKTRDNGIRTDVYVWNGKQYVQRNERFSQYYSAELTELHQEIYSGKALPISARLTLCKRAVRIYTLQRRYSEAIRLLGEILVMIENPDLTKPNSVAVEGGPPDQQERISRWFEIEKDDGKAVIHRLMGDSYKASGDLPGSRKEYAEAEILESKAREQKARIHYSRARLIKSYLFGLVGPAVSCSKAFLAVHSQKR